MNNSSDSPILSINQFNTIRNLIREYSGLKFGDDVYENFSDRLGTRLTQLHISNFSAYLDLLIHFDSDDHEIKELVEIFSNRETYFFREQNQLDLFVREIMDRIIEEKKAAGLSRIKIWSVGCATGEEPYSIAILLAENGIPEDISIEILGFDISEQSIRNARRGIYRQTSFRYTSPHFLQTYFTGTGDGRYVINDNIRQRVLFVQKNIVKPGDVDLMGFADAVFCRNVIIYYNTETREKLITWLYNHLTPGAYLLLGHSESLLNMETPFRDISMKNEIVYRKD